MDNNSFCREFESHINSCLLSSRGYSGKKLTENVECEIFQTILEEARESYRKEMVHELKSNTPDEMETNLDQIEEWVRQWSG